MASLSKPYKISIAMMTSLKLEIRFEENALIKARYVYKKFGVNCFADDTGLEVEL